MKQHSRNASFFTALIVGAAVTIAACWLKPQFAATAGANAFFLTYLILSAVKLNLLTPEYLRKHAAGADMPAWVIFAATLGAAIVAVASLFLLINTRAPYHAIELTLSLASVALGWATIHTMAAFHYAHVIWDVLRGTEADDSALAGLEFPRTPEPAGYDFLYFAFVVGMTAQTSDVVVTNTSMRKLVVLHGVVSFLFNTVLVAAAVNVAVSLAS
jgi:uncharacterized membrane protein